ncbi:hypothetical protein SUDANB58_02906 [Streptomyces sp. enrichment culture]|uniref:hypothetical protein n=1 Tax=Streptomyces sp. enrichment culture TaxID=1795815 RepID=UPI003F576586
MAVVVLTAVIGGLITSRDDADTAAVGDCMHRGSSNDSGPDLEAVECDAKTEYIPSTW